MKKAIRGLKVTVRYFILAPVFLVMLAGATLIDLIRGRSLSEIAQEYKEGLKMLKTTHDANMDYVANGLDE